MIFNDNAKTWEKTSYKTLVIKHGQCNPTSLQHFWDTSGVTLVHCCERFTFNPHVRPCELSIMEFGVYLTPKSGVLTFSVENLKLLAYVDALANVYLRQPMVRHS